MGTLAEPARRLARVADVELKRRGVLGPTTSFVPPSQTASLTRPSMSRRACGFSHASYTLSDEQWAQIAPDVMRRTGLAPYGLDDDAVRWVVVRYGSGHIHIVVTCP